MGDRDKVMQLIALALLALCACAQPAETTSAERIARLGASGNDNVADVKRLEENPRVNAGLLIAALHTIPDSEKFARADNPSMEHALWLIRALRYLTGGKDFRASSRHVFGRSYEEKNRKYFLSLAHKDDLAFFAYWMSRNRWYIAPVDAQKDIIAQWQRWYATSGAQFEYQPLQNPSPENWIW